MKEPFDVVAAVDELLERETDVWPCHINRASSIGHPCERHLVYCRTHWKDRRPMSVKQKKRVELGNVVEKMVIRKVEDAGFRVTHQQVTLEIPGVITGHPDGWISKNGSGEFPLDVKSMAPHLWKKVSSYEDVIGSSHWWIQKYAAQMQVYCHIPHKPMGLLVPVNVATGEYRQVWVDYDLNHMNEILRKAERINAHIAAGTLPDRVDGGGSVCDMCDFAHICNPDVIGAGVELMDSAEIEAMLERREELTLLVKEPNKELKDINEELKDKFEGRGDLLIGKWHVTGKTVSRKPYSVAAGSYWSWKAVKVE